MARINRGLVLTASDQVMYTVPSGQTLRITALQCSSQEEIAVTDSGAAQVDVSWSDGANSFALVSNLTVPRESVVDLAAGEVSLESGHTISASASRGSVLTLTLCGELQGA